MSRTREDGPMNHVTPSPDERRQRMVKAVAMFSVLMHSHERRELAKAGDALAQLAEFAIVVRFMRRAVRRRRPRASPAELRRRLDALEQKCDRQFAELFQAIHALLEPPPGPKRGPIGFHTLGAGEEA